MFAEESFAVQSNRKIFAFCGNKLLRFVKINPFCGKKLLRFLRVSGIQGRTTQTARKSTGKTRTSKIGVLSIFLMNLMMELNYKIAYSFNVDLC